MSFISVKQLLQFLDRPYNALILTHSPKNWYALPTTVVYLNDRDEVFRIADPSNPSQMRRAVDAKERQKSLLADMRQMPESGSVLRATFTSAERAPSIAEEIPLALVSLPMNRNLLIAMCVLAVGAIFVFAREMAFLTRAPFKAQAKANKRRIGLAKPNGEIASAKPREAVVDKAAAE